MANSASVQQYLSHEFPNGLRIVYLPSVSSVSYCGFAINAGARDENPQQSGLAHFVEHLLFKGTLKRKAWHILNRMENVGGELNAYTTKEETFLYSVCLSEDTGRAMELLADLVFHSQFPETEIEKEREVIFDEINSYEDNPSELIFDEFENLLFKGNEIGHNILGEKETLNSFTTGSCREFVDSFYHPGNMIFFFYGKTSFKQIIRLADKYFTEKKSLFSPSKKRTSPEIIPPVKEKIEKKLHQTHVIIGGKGYSYHHKQRMGLYLLNNILGGPGMNSRLNISLREKRGLVYTVESNLISYGDTGFFNIYLGCDPKLENKCIRIVYSELKKLREAGLTASQLNAAVKQLKGQLGIASENKENIALKTGKSFLHLNQCDNLAETYKKIDAITSLQLLEIANEIYDEQKLFQLIYH
ncbi:MAG: insulinase family protein [Dysgonamonadaceae bacterium]|jgi:predicted Zn-dependent peptidase|nr:insulinase family protein [Dysgonamonadaceae bacterium]